MECLLCGKDHNDYMEVLAISETGRCIDCQPNHRDIRPFHYDYALANGKESQAFYYYPA